MLTREGLVQLQTAEGARALAAAQAALEVDPDYLRAAQRLSPTFPEALARAAVEQIQLRRRAATKLADPSGLFFTREGLEQATPEAVARHRAARFVGFPIVCDMGAGLGFDSLALARQGAVVAIDRDPLRLLVLRANASRLGLGERILPVQGDLRSLPVAFPRPGAAFCDPGRRSGGRRWRAVEAYDPPLSVVLSWLPRLDGLAVKVSPAVKMAEVGHLPSEIEFISLHRELKEATLWFGSLRRGVRRATVLPAGASLEGEREPQLPIGPIAGYLLEPDPAVLRAGLVLTLGVQLGAHPIAADISFLSTDDLRPSAFARAYRVIEAMPFRLKSLQQMLDAREIGHLTVKRRGSAVEPEDIVRKLRLRGEGEALVVLTRHADRQTMILAEPLGGSGRREEATLMGSTERGDLPGP